MQSAVKKPLPAQTARDQNYLKANGWRLITSTRSKYGMHYYWDHPDHQRNDGFWWFQGSAVLRQRRIDGSKSQAKAGA